MSVSVHNYGSIVRELITEAVVFADSRFGDRLAPPAVVTALWDTGAYSTVVNQKIVDALGLIPVNHSRACGVNGWYESPIYVIDLQLPNGVKITGLPVSLGNMVVADVLIGMDVISMGDLKLTNDGTTKFTLRTPSEGDAPFVAPETAQEGGK